MADQVPIAQTDLLCTSCAGQCAFDPATGHLLCDSCGTGHIIAVDAWVNAAAEQPYHPDLPHTEQPKFSQDRPYQCQTCGGEVVFQGHSISQNCPYCNGVLVECPRDESYPTLGMIPFAVAPQSAQDNVVAWGAARWAAPSDLAGIIAQSSVAGIYVPFWTFDSQEAVNYTVWYTKKSGKKTSIRFKRGLMRTSFDDLLMPASPHVTPLIRDGILHEFEPDRLRPFEPAYLAGFAAERHHQSVREGLASNADDKDVLLRNQIKRHSRKSSIINISYKTDTTGLKYRRILLPVWLLHYTYGGKPMKVVTCGLHGRTFGERPFSMAKLYGMATALAAVATGIGLVWGAGQIF